MSFDIKFTRLSFQNACGIDSLKSEPIGKLINRIPGSGLLISSLPGLASRMHVESRGKHSISLAWLT